MKYDKLIKSLEDFRELVKSNYGPKGYGQYTPADNIKRKAKNVEEDVVEGPNKNAKRYTSAVKGTAKQQAAKEAREMRAKSKKNPVKIYTPEEIAALNEERKKGVKKNDELASPSSHKEKTIFNKNGQWNIKKTGGYGTAVTAAGPAGGGGLPLGAANKNDKLPGGKADNKSPKDFCPDALKDGTQHEMEHTKDRDLAREIAMDHLTEDPEYYKKLKRLHT